MSRKGTRRSLNFNPHLTLFCQTEFSAANKPILVDLAAQMANSIYKPEYQRADSETVLHADTDPTYCDLTTFKKVQVAKDGEAALYHSTDGRMGLPGDWQLLTFRGTDNLKDGATDLAAWTSTCQIEGPCGNVHKGFYARFLDVYPQLVANIDRNKPNVLVVGHSLGW